MLITKHDVEHIAELADIGISDKEVDEFTHQFNGILDYFDLLDEVPSTTMLKSLDSNIMREDEVTPSLSPNDAIVNVASHEGGFIKAPRVM
jgi:aspartyl-tRNA(Asn)/glutamyl-tRNA(Gln) amidotransferase subunit C